MQTHPFLHCMLLGIAVAQLSSCSFPGGEHATGTEKGRAPAATSGGSAGAEPGRQVSFQRQIKPVLESKCLACHSGESAPWGFSLESREQAFTPGTAGPRIIPGKPEHSLILALASTHKNVAVMPLVGRRLTAAESETLRQWILEGAAWPEGHAGHLNPPPHAREGARTGTSEEWRNGVPTERRE